ncbi:Beta-galactosidase [Candidatus Sulfopaludibacter sp. SbA4]|nr:Beta-galactosidase [Candidatus Sulfopaludibacter sp. SbA4]
MKMRVSLLAFCCTALAAPADWFPPSNLMTIGVYYYPEAWPEAQWPRDMANIRKLGMEFVHMGEFAWYFMEPEEGKYQLDWLEKNVDLAAANGLKVILCTPSATPPIWLTRKHPEILMVDSTGRTMNHGGREQADWSAPLYREYVTRIDTALAKRFGHNPKVWGWQLDNEVSHYDKQYSYSPAATQRFREWLRRKYGAIDRLNTDWGGRFWSLMYQNFDQIDLPNLLEHPGDPSPHALLDLDRWFAEEAADYLRMQTGILRKYGTPCIEARTPCAGQWITTNFMAMHGDVDPTLSARDLDAFTWTHYPVHGDLFPEEGPLGFRLGSGAIQGFMHDFMRPINGISGLMELQPGQVNWGVVNPWPLPGAIHMWIMRAFGAGARLVCTYRYRQPLFGSEEYHKGLVETDGVTPSPGGREYAEAMRDVLQLRGRYRAGQQPPADYAARRTAFLIDFSNRWDIQNHKQTARWDTIGHWMKYYRALKSMMAPVDVVTEDRDLTSYPFVVAPAYQLVDQELVKKLTTYAENGGNLVLTCRTGEKDRRGQLWEALWAEPIYGLIGAKIPFYDLLPPPVEGHVTADGKPYAWGAWGEVLEAQAGTTVLATYSDQFYAGKAAAVTRKLGKGSVTYIGVDSETGDLEMALLRKVYAGVSPASLRPDFLVDWRDGFWVATNFTSTSQPVPAKAGTPMLIGAKDVPPGGVAVWQ